MKPIAKVPASPRAVAPADYARLLTTLKERIQTARAAAVRAVNSGLVGLYWDIGHSIVERQRRHRWGDAVVARIARDLRRAFPEMTGFSASSLWRMRQLYLALTEPEFLAQLVRELPRRRRGPEILAQAVRELATSLPWGHHVELLNKVGDPAQRLFYLQQAARHHWSRRTLAVQIHRGLHRRTRPDAKSHNFAKVLPEHVAAQAEEALKSSYNLEFLGLTRAVHERDLEDRLVEMLKDFILELGYGFCFIARQHRLDLGRKTYTVDLLFYHRFLKTLVAFDLKIREFEPEFAGKMDFYLDLLNERERAPGDGASIGIILCPEQDDLVVEYALKSKSNPIGVARYDMQTSLPDEFRGKLPTARQLRAALAPALPGPPRRAR